MTLQIPSDACDVRQPIGASLSGPSLRVRKRGRRMPKFQSPRHQVRIASTPCASRCREIGMDYYLNVAGLVIFTGILALFTAMLAIFTKRLWSDARILQRAYIAVEPLGIHLMKNGSDLIGHVGIKNAGHLP